MKKVKTETVVLATGLTMVAIAVWGASCTNLRPLPNPSPKPQASPVAITHLEDASVRVTNPEGTSGGTGNVIYASDAYSLVLTNKHVCQVPVNGGIVTDDQGKSYKITSWKESAEHDLCVITVSSRLPAVAKLASHPAERYDEITAVGHPSLLPTTATSGKITGRMNIQVVIGVRKCTKEEEEDQGASLLCRLMGGLPDIHTFDALSTSSIISPGSSGSAVYNKDGELVAVMFAGRGDLGFGFAVPYEYINKFLMAEYDRLPSIKPNDSMSFSPGKGKSVKERFQQAKDTCAKIKKATDLTKRVCAQIEEYYKNTI